MCRLWLLFSLFIALFGQSLSNASESTNLACPIFRSQDFRRVRDEIVNPIKQSILSSVSGNAQFGISIEWNDESCILTQTEDLYSELERNKKRSKGLMWQCQICKKTFRSEYHVDKHLVTKHPELVSLDFDHRHDHDHDHGLGLGLGLDGDRGGGGRFCAGHWCGKILPCGPAPERELFGNVAVSMNASYLKSALHWCYSVDERKKRESECIEQLSPCISMKRSAFHGNQDTFAYDIAVKKLAVLCEESVHDECSNLRRPMRELAQSNLRVEVLSSYRLPQYDKIDVSEIESKYRRNRRIFASGDMDDTSGGRMRWRFVLGVVFSVGLAVFYILARVVSRLRHTGPDLTRRVDGQVADGQSGAGRSDRHRPIGAGAMQHRKGRMLVRAIQDLQRWWTQLFQLAARKKKNTDGAGAISVLGLTCFVKSLLAVSYELVCSLLGSAVVQASWWFVFLRIPPARIFARYATIGGVVSKEVERRQRTSRSQRKSSQRLWCMYSCLRSIPHFPFESIGSGPKQVCEQLGHFIYW